MIWESTTHIKAIGIINHTDFLLGDSHTKEEQNLPDHMLMYGNNNSL